MSFLQQGLQGGQGQAPNPALFSQLFGPGNGNQEELLSMLGQQFGQGGQVGQLLGQGGQAGGQGGQAGGQGDFLQQLLAQFLGQGGQAQGSLSGAFQGFGGNNFQNSGQGGIGDLFRGNASPQLLGRGPTQPTQRQIDVGNRNQNLGGGFR